MKTLTTEQIKLANQLISTGVTQAVVASMLKVSRKVLRRELSEGNQEGNAFGIEESL